MSKKNINKDTILCISIAQKPSNFGTTVFNAAFDSLQIDAIYKACQLNPNNLSKALDGIKALNIRGCGVSMPFKQEIIKYLDSTDPLAEKIGAVNTVVNNNGHLRGYNTDYYGALSVLAKVPKLREKRVVILGAGGVAQAISCALQKLQAMDVVVITRSKSKGSKLVKKWGLAKRLPWSNRHNIKADLLINATSVGMSPQSSNLPISHQAIHNYGQVMDVVVNPLESALIKASRAQHKPVIMGYQMSLAQAVKQFELYLGRPAPYVVMEKAMKKMLNQQI